MYNLWSCIHDWNHQYDHNSERDLRKNSNIGIAGFLTVESLSFQKIRRKGGLEISDKIINGSIDLKADGSRSI